MCSLSFLPKQLLTCSSSSKEEFAQEYKKLYQKEEPNKLYKLTLIELNKVISLGDVDNYKKLSSLIESITNVENCAGLKDCYNSLDNPLTNTNIIILACKYNVLDILKHIFCNSSILNNLSVNIGKDAFAPGDKDEMCHNSFYYAIRSGNVEILETLINKWPDNYFSVHLKELDEILSSAYEELKLKNVPLSDEIEIFVENKLLDLRFFSEASDQTQSILDENNMIRERIQLVLENISSLLLDYPLNTKLIDERFLYMAKFIAQNIHILKQLLKSTYNTLPWEEIEFCLIVYIRSHINQEENNLFSNAVLNKCRILNHLKHFGNKLKKYVLYNSDFSKCSDLPNIRREKIVEQIIANNPQFEELYNDYQEIRDICSLQTISDYIKLAVSVDPTEREGRLIITRALQVIGEYLKNTFKSPNLSSTTSELLLLSLPKNTKEVIADLRNSLSHASSLQKRKEIESNIDTNFFTSIQNDAKKVGEVVTNILFNSKIKTIRMLLEKIINSENFDEIKEFVAALSHIKLDETSANFRTEEHERLEKLIDELCNTVSIKTDQEQGFFKEIYDIINFEKSKLKNISIDYILGFSSLQVFSIYLNDNEMDAIVVRDVKYTAKQSRDYLTPKIESNSCKKVIELSSKICDSVLLRSAPLKNVAPRIKNGSLDEIALVLQSYVGFDLQHDPKVINRLLFEIVNVAQFEINNIKWIEELKQQLSKKCHFIPACKQKTCAVPEEKYYNQLKVKLSELEDILSKDSFCSQSSKSFSSYKKNKKLQAMIEMLVLDIMSILGTSRKCLQNNLLFLDDNAPLLTGKCLRNHLAHYNTLVDVLLSDPLIAVVLNAKKLTSENIIQNKRKIGKSVIDNVSKQKYKINQDLLTISNQNQLFIALEEDNMEALNFCLKRGGDIKGRNIYLWTALHFAAKGSNLECIKFIYDLNPIICKDIHGRNPLHIAVEYGKKCVIEFLIKEVGIFVDDLDNWGKTALHIAAQNGRKDAIELLLENNADIASYDKSGLSSLYHAIRNGHIGVAKVLLEKGNVDLNEVIGGFTPLHEAARKGFLSFVIFLIQKGANINVKNDRGWTPLFAAADNGHLEVVNYLIANGADVNAKVIDGCTILHYAVRNGEEDIVEVLLKHGAKVNVFHKTLHDTPIHYAADSGHEKIVKKLLQNCANSNAVTFGGLAPIHIAAKRGHIKVVSVLLEHGVNIDARDKNNSTPLLYAAEFGHKLIVDLLTKGKALVNAVNIDGITPLHRAAQKDHIEVLNILLKYKADINARSIGGLTPLHLAALEGKNDIIYLLIKKNTDVNSKDINGLTPLYAAAQNGHYDTVALLIKHNAEVNVKGNKGVATALQVAAMNGHKDIIGLLLKNTAIVNAKDKLGCTPLYAAVKESHKEIADILITNGGLNNMTKEDKNELLISAVVNNCKDIVEILLANGINANLCHNAVKLAVLAGYRDLLGVFLKKKVDINFKNEKYTLLHVAAKAGHKEIVNDLIVNGACVDAIIGNVTPLLLAVKEGHAEVAEILIVNGAKVDNKSFLGFTPLYIAAKYGLSTVAKVLLDNKANIEFQDVHNFRTPVETAVLMGHLQVLQIMLQYKEINVDTAGHLNFTLLHIAAEGNQLGMVKYLIEKGANIHAKNFKGTQPIHVAARKGFKNIVAFLLSKGSNITDCGCSNQSVLHYATLEGRIEVVQYLIEQGGDVNAKDMDDLMPAHFAAVLGYKDVLRMLLENGAVYNVIDKINRKRPLEMAEDEGVINILSSTERLFKVIRKNSPHEVENCIKAGAVVNAKHSENGAALHYAAWKGYLEVTKILLENKSNPNAVNGKAFTPLHYAAKFSHLNVVKVLLCNGAKHDVVSDNNKTPLDLAVDKSIITLLELVIESFKHVKNDNSRVIYDLKKIKDITTVKAILNARNIDNQTLVITALHNNFSRVDQLKEMLQGGVSSKISTALVYFNQNKYQTALTIFRGVLEERKEILGSDNPGTLDIQSYIAKIFYKQGAYEEALNLLEEIFHKQKEMFGLNNKYTLSTRSAIALILHRQGKNEALDIFKEVFGMQKELLGTNHTDTLETQLYLAIALDGHEKYDEALFHNQEVYKRRKEKKHPAALLAQNNIALVLSNQGKLDEALELYKKVLNKKKTLFGKTHADTLRTSQHIALILSKQKKFPEALKAHEELLDIQKCVLGPTHPDTLNTEYSLADVLFTQRKWIAALKVYKNILNLRKAVWGPNDHTVLTILTRIETINLMFKFEGCGETTMLRQLQSDIIIAAKDGDKQAIQHLLNNGADVNDEDADKRTPLHFASNNGHISIVKFLLERGADATLVTNKGNTSLHTAVTKGYNEIVQNLLQHTSPDKLNDFINAQTTSGKNTALHVAVKNGSLDIVLSLLKYGAIYNIKNKEKNMPFDISENQIISNLLKLVEELFEDAKKGDISIFKKLKSARLDHLSAITNVRNYLGHTIVQAAITKGHKTIATELLKIVKQINH